MTGLTNAQGQYNYRAGDTVTFDIGGRPIGNPVLGAPEITPLSLFNTNDITNQQVVNLSRLLLTLGGGAPNGNNVIVINSAPLPSLPATLNFNVPTTTFAATMAAAGGGTGPTLVSETNATSHLQQNFATITVTLAGSGTGTVTSQPGGINCPTTCSFAFNKVNPVTLQPVGTGFAGWSNGTGSAAGCTGTTANCSFTPGSDSNITATFNVAPPATLTTSVVGSGSVSCSVNGGAFGACAGPYASGTALVIQATANSGSTFTGWSAGSGNATICNNTTGNCSFTITANSSITANFAVNVTLFSVTAAAATGNGGGGTVQCSANGGAAGACGSYPVGTAVSVIATPNGVSLFSGWSGGNGSGLNANCNSATGPCNFTLTGNTTITGNFNRPVLTVNVAGTGTVNSNPTGITNCTTLNCQAPFDKGAVITLTASGTGFSGWSLGSCPGTGTCVVTLNSNTTVTATYGAPLPPMTINRAGHAAVRLANGQVLITGGFSSSVFPAPALNTAELYDPTANTFTALTGRMRSARTSHTATLLPNGQVLLTGGHIDTEGDGINSAELYDPATQTFTAIAATMTSPRGGHVAVLLPNDQVLLSGGFNNDSVALNTAELYNPTTQTFTAIVATMASRRESPTATRLPDGKVLIAGGGSSDVSFNTAELYDPTANTFTALTATMTAAREGHKATLLPSGLVLLTGGSIESSSPRVILNTVEVYDPTAQTFTAATATMASPRAFHEATRLPNGTVLLTGGVNVVSTNSFVVFNTAEVYRP